MAGGRPAVKFARRNSEAFTLIELLAVIAIIAVLAALLMPAISGAMSKGKAAKCVSQARQILAARILYASDNYGNLIPNRPRWPEDPSGRCTWRWYLAVKYGTGTNIFACPGADVKHSEVEMHAGFGTAKSDMPANYAQVSEVYGNDMVSRRMAVIPSPAKQLEIFETRDYWPDMNMGSWGWVWADGYGVYGYWHSSRMTAGYADGHVELKKLGETATPNCEWDTPRGPHDGKTHPEYGPMLAQYK